MLLSQLKLEVLTDTVLTLDSTVTMWLASCYREESIVDKSPWRAFQSNLQHGGKIQTFFLELHIIVLCCSYRLASMLLLEMYPLQGWIYT